MLDPARAGTARQPRSSGKPRPLRHRLFATRTGAGCPGRQHPCPSAPLQLSAPARPGAPPARSTPPPCAGPARPNRPSTQPSARPACATKSSCSTRWPPPTAAAPPLADRADAPSTLIWEGQDTLAPKELGALQQEYYALFEGIEAGHDGDLDWEERQVLYAAHGALALAATSGDRHTRRLLSAATGVLADGPGPLATADVIRCPGHYASAPAGCRHRPNVCRALPALPPSGTDTVLSRAAHQAAQLLAEAARVPWGGDEHWIRCGDLIEQAIAATRDGLRSRDR